MLYDKYETRVRKNILIQKIIIKHKIPILITLAVLIILFVIYSFTKGNISNVKYEASIQYGENFEINSQALMSNVSYEYKKIGDDTWTTQVPKIAGEYEVKITSKKVFGIKNSKTYAFTIIPRELDIEIKEDTILFGTKLSTRQALINGDRIASIKYTYGDITQKETSVIGKEAVIIDNNGDDITSSYQINYIEKNIKFTTSTLGLKLKDKKIIYDGKELTSKEYDLIGNLSDEFTIKYETMGSQTNVGTSENKISSFSIYYGDIDVTHQINPNHTAGKLEVTKRDITVKPKDVTKEYDGLSLTSNDAETTNLVKEHKASITTNGSITDANYSQNTIKSLEITDKNGNDVTTNYNIKTLPGTLTIKKRNIEIKTSDLNDIEYDRNYYSNNQYEIVGSLAPNQKENINFIVSVTNAGTHNNVMSFKIKDINQNDVTSNYDISYIYGKITISPRKLVIKTNDYISTYNGGSHYDKEINIVEGTLAYQQNIRLNSFTSIINVGTKINKFTVDVIDENLNINTKNYDIKFIEGTITVNPLEITVTSENLEGIYDSYVHSNLKYKIDNEIVKGHMAEIVDFTTIKNVGQTLNKIEIRIYNQNEDVTPNYKINYNFGTLKINKRDITIKPKDIKRTYDGTILTSKTVEYIKGYLGYNDLISIDTKGSIIDVGKIDNEIRAISIIDTTNGTEVNNNYNILNELGTLTITQQPITVKPLDISKVYDGKELTSALPEVVGTGLAEGDFIEIITNGQITDAGTSNNEIIGTPKIISRSRNLDVSNNYEITNQIGELRITQKSITIKPKDETKIYDGKELISIVALDFNKDLIDTENIFIKTDGKPINVLDNKINTITSVKIEKADGTDSTGNYNITKQTGLLTISPRPITITTGSATKEYDGTPLSIDYNYLSSGAIIESEELEVIINVTITDAISVSNSINSISITKLDGTSSRDNYKITEQLGTLTITPRAITIKPKDETKVYDGKELISNTPEYDNDRLVSGETIILTTKGKPVNVVENHENEIDKIAILNSNGTSSINNYTITKQKGFLTITPRPITIRPKEETKVYDGKELVSNTPEYDNDRLIFGEHLIITTDNKLIDVGSITENNIVTANIYKSSGEDSTNNYNITRKTGSLTITPRDITIKPKDEIKIYDGQPFVSNKAVDVNGELVFGETIILKTKGKPVDVVENYENEIDEVTITKSDGTQSTNNYTITKQIGSLTITKRPITIKPKDESKAYDGKELVSNDPVDVNSELVFGERIVITTDKKIIDVGSTNQNNIVTTDIYKANEGTSTNNYHITILPGTLTITKKQVTIITLGLELAYDGNIHSNKEYTTEGLIHEHETSLDPDKSIPTIKNVGRFDNDLTVIIKDSKENDVSDNYDIIYVYGKLVITRREITVITGSKTAIYDGTEHYNEKIEIDKGSLVSGQKYNVTSYTKQINATDSTGISNKVTVEIIGQNETDDYTNNYMINFIEGRIIVNKKPITVKTSSHSIEFDGKYHRGDYEIVGELSSEYESQINSYVSGYGVDKHVNKIKIWIYKDRLDVTDNFDITYLYGIIEITKRQITIISGSKIKEYDGTEINSFDTKTTSENLVVNHRIEITKSTRITNVGETTNTIEISIIDDSLSELTGKTGNVTYCYDISYENIGKLEITKRSINIKPEDSYKEYDGQPLIASKAQVISDKLLALGDEITAIITSGSQTDIGKSTTKIISYTIKNKNGNDVTKNYNVEANTEGTLTVNKREIAIKIKDEQKVYDGKSLVFKETQDLNKKLLEGHKIVHQFDTSDIIKNAGTLSSDKGTFEIYDGNKKVSYLYNISIIEGQLQIDPLKINVQAASKTTVYNGTNYIYETTSYYINPESFIDNHSHKLKFGAVLEGTGIKQLEFVKEGSKIVNSLNEDMSMNYTFNIKGELKITKATLIITAASEEKEYDEKELTNNSYTTSGLLGGHEVTVEIIGNITDVGREVNKVGTVVVKDGNLDVTAYYEITRIDGMLRITDSIE